MHRLFTLIVILALGGIAGWYGLIQSQGAAAATPTPAPTAAHDETSFNPSPDGSWTAVVNTSAGSLDLQGLEGKSVNALRVPAGSTIGQVAWSPDSRSLLVVRNNWTPKQPLGTGVDVSSSIEIWQVQFKDDQPGEPARLYQSAAPPEDGPQQIVLGHWSPDSRYVLFWEGILSASILADGLPLAVLDVSSGQVSPVAEIALLNPRYQSWSPDSSRLAVTAGGYRSALVDKWLTVWDAASGVSTTVISQTEQIPGTLAWSPKGDLIAYAAVSAKLTGPEWADIGTFDIPAVAGRRIYLLDPATGQYRRLNEVESYQDAPVWSDDGRKLYYVQRNDDLLEVVAADPATGQTETLPGRSQPVEAPDLMGPLVGYYGQFGREELLADLPTGQASAPGDEDQDILRFIFKNRQPEIGTLSEDFLNLVAAGQFSDYQRQDADVNGDDQPEILISGRNDTYYLFVAIVKRDAGGKLQELFYTDNLNGKYVGEVRVTLAGQRVVADFLTTTGGTGYVETTWEQRWIQCQADSCSQVWSAPLLWADRSAQWTLARNSAVAEVAQPDAQTIHLVTHRFGLIELPWGETDAPPRTARRVIGPDTRETYRWDGQVYQLESREQVAVGQEIAREFDAQTGETEALLFEALTQPLLQADGNYDYAVYLKTQAELWGLPAPDQPDDPTWGAASRALDIASHTGGPEQLGEWATGVIGALDKPLCRVTVLRHAEGKLNRTGQVELPCTINFTRLAWADVTGDGQAELLLTTIPPDEDSLGQMERLIVFAVADNGMTELAQLDGVINGADGRGIRWQQPAEGFEVEAGLPLLDPDAAETWSDLRLEREFQTYRWDEERGEFKPE